LFTNISVTFGANSIFFYFSIAQSNFYEIKKIVRIAQNRYYPLTEEQKQQIIFLHGPPNNFGARIITRRMNATSQTRINENTVKSALRRYNQRGNLERPQG